MARTKRRLKRLETIWECPDNLWNEFIQPVLQRLDLRKPGPGRCRIDPRKALNGMIYQMRTGCQWNALPKRFGDDSSVHRTMQRWIERGVFEEIWAVLIDHCDELDGVDWQWQSADAAMGKAFWGGTKSVKTLRIVGKTVPSAA
jgi:putative transposase